MDVLKHGFVIEKYHELNKRLKPYDLQIHAWGRLAVRKISNPYGGYIINNVDSIDVIEGFVKGLEHAQPELKIDPNA
jgi:hypothetical protein